MISLAFLRWAHRGRSLVQLEVGAMVQSKDYRHMSIRGLALRAQRTGKVFAHPGTWAKLIRERGARRLRMRLHPAKPRIGFRAAAPNEALHIDVTIIKLLDGTKAYLHAFIDNYLGKILAWTVGDKLNPMNTCLVLNQAAHHRADRLEVLELSPGNDDNKVLDITWPFISGMIPSVMSR
jgi:hypothetical protein